MISLYDESAFDIIGDIHGQFAKLQALLSMLGYAEDGGVWRHPSRRAIFVGDFIDRGPQQLAVVDTVRRMVDAGSALAVMGNHEFNAIAWATPDPDCPGDFLRPHGGEVGAKNRRQHAAFLAEVQGQPQLHSAVIDWFMTLPLWLELPGLRVVHACWHPEFMQKLQPVLMAGQRLSPSLLERASRKGTPEYIAVETLLKGEEIALPAGMSFLDKDGHERREVRTRWWLPSTQSMADVAMGVPTHGLATLRDVPLPPGLLRMGDEKPTFFGHYWMSGAPQLLSPHRACVDYSAGKGGPLVAYRWQGEAQLNPQHFVAAA